MRAKVASRSKGHVFEKRFMDLKGFKLAIAYKQAVREEELEMKDTLALNEAWSKKIDNLFESLFMFVNPKVYQGVQEARELKTLEKEITVEEFPVMWDELMQVIPDEIIVDDIVADPLSMIPKADPEIEEYITGFAPYKPRKEGDS